jgi:hypothetical protein
MARWVRDAFEMMIPFVGCCLFGIQNITVRRTALRVRKSPFIQILRRLPMRETNDGKCLKNKFLKILHEKRSKFMKDQILSLRNGNSCRIGHQNVRSIIRSFKRDSFISELDVENKKFVWFG